LIKKADEIMAEKQQNHDRQTRYIQNEAKKQKSKLVKNILLDTRKLYFKAATRGSQSKIYAF
jgi:hypothetical protein